MNRSLLFFCALLAISTGFLAAQSVGTSDDTVLLADYYYPLQQGARWHYQGTDGDGEPAHIRLILANTDWPLTLWTGRSNPSSYQQPALRLLMESGTWDVYGFDPYYPYDTWSEYKTLNTAYGYYGDDNVSDAGKDELRFDQGFSFPLSAAVGQSYQDTSDVYSDGVFVFEAVLEMQVLDTSPVTVPADTFVDCVHLRFTVTDSGTVIDQWDEWWARGVGVVKLQGLDGSGASRLRELTSWSVPSIDSNLADALDTPGRVWFNGGNIPWGNQSAVTHDSQDAARAGAISGSETSWMETVVEGPCRLEFWWKANLYGGDGFMIQIGDSYSDWGVAPGGGSISYDWTKFSMDLPLGSHVVRWTWRNGTGSATGQGGLWIDEVNLPRPVSPLIVERERMAPRMATTGDNIDFTIDPSIYGRRYQLQQRETLESGNWVDEGPEYEGNGGSLVIRTIRDAGTPRRFYRIALDPESDTATP